VAWASKVVKDPFRAEAGLMVRPPSSPRFAAADDETRGGLRTRTACLKIRYTVYNPGRIINFRKSKPTLEFHPISV